MNFIRRLCRFWKHDRAMFKVLHATQYLADQENSCNEAFGILWDALTEMLNRRRTL